MAAEVTSQLQEGRIFQTTAVATRAAIVKMVAAVVVMGMDTVPIVPVIAPHLPNQIVAAVGVNWIIVSGRSGNTLVRSSSPRIFHQIAVTIVTIDPSTQREDLRTSKATGRPRL